MRAFSALISLIVVGNLVANQLCLGQGDPSSISPEAIPQDVLNTAPLFSIAEKMSLLELDVLGRSAPKKEAIERLNILESEIFGKEFKVTGNSLVVRIADVLTSLRPSNELVIHLVQEKLTVPNWSVKVASPPWLNTSSQLVAMLEIELLGKLNSKDLLIDRIRKLQQIVWPDKTPPTQAPVSDQIAMLMNAVPASQVSMEKAQQQTKSGDIPILNSLGKGVKKAGRRVAKYAQPARGFLQSPTFWLCLLGAGAVTGLYFATRGSASNSSGPVTFPNRGCQGLSDCHYCTNCHDCVWCNQGGSPMCNKSANY